VSRQGLALLAALALCGPACREGTGAHEGAARAPIVARDADLVPVSPPPTEGLESVGQEILHDREAKLRTLAVDAATSRPALGAAYGELGKAYHAFELYEPAAACFENASRLSPRDLAWPYLLARARAGQKEFDAAVEAVGRVLAVEPVNLRAMLYLGEVETAAGRIDRAKDAYEKALAAFPDSGPTLFALGRIALLTGDAPQAIRYLERALVSEPSASRIHSLLADAYRQTGDPEKAAQHRAERGDRVPALGDPLLDEVAEINPRNYASRALQALRSGNAGRAVALLQAESAAIPEDAEVRVQLGIALTHAGASREALAQFREALRLQPENARALFYLGTTLASAGRTEDAVATLRRALARSPESGPAHLALARALRHLGRSQEALASLDEAVRYDPTSAEARGERIQALADLGRCREAQRELDASIVALPGEPSFAALRARVTAGCPPPANPHP
jgi:tetratricopeptide (TPR) repeat protein